MHILSSHCRAPKFVSVKLFGMILNSNCLQVTRNILGTEPRVTRFKINWDDSDGAEDGATDGPTVESTTANIDVSSLGHSSNGSTSAGISANTAMEVA